MHARLHGLGMHVACTWRARGLHMACTCACTRSHVRTYGMRTRICTPTRPGVRRRRANPNPNPHLNPNPNPNQVWGGGELEVRYDARYDDGDAELRKRAGRVRCA